MRLLVLPRAKGRISVVARAPTLLGTLCSPPFVLYPALILNSLFFLPCRCNYAENRSPIPRYGCAMLILERISEGTLQRVHAHTCILPFFFLLKPRAANGGEHFDAHGETLFNLRSVSEIKNRA